VVEKTRYTLRISRRAESDLERIQRETLQLHGEMQMRLYGEEIKKTFATLLDHPMVGHVRSDIPKGYRAIAAGKHMVVYRIEDSVINVITILHGRMNFAPQFDS
jgi:toxin ParE1/3/4